MNRLQNVVALSRVIASGLSDMKKTAADKVSVPNDLQWEQISIQTPAKLSIINKVENKQHLWQTELVFRSCQVLEILDHWCYQVTLANGQKFLIGSYERPYPVTTANNIKPDNLSDSQLTEYSVTLISRSNLPEIA